MTLLPTWWREYFLWVEFALAVLLTAIFSVLAYSQAWFPDIDKLLSGNRAAVYGALASIFGALLGFVITSISIVLAFANDPRFEVVRKSKQYPNLWGIFTASVRAFGLATAAALVALIFDRDGRSHSWILVACVGATMLATLRLLRAIWVLEKMIHVVVQKPAVPPASAT